MRKRTIWHQTALHVVKDSEKIVSDSPMHFMVLNNIYKYLPYTGFKIGTRTTQLWQMKFVKWLSISIYSEVVIIRFVGDAYSYFNLFMH